jgi:hypothetical protein
MKGRRGCARWIPLPAGLCDTSTIPRRNTFRKTDRVLVLVEVREGIAAPPELTSDLADSIDRHLWRYHAVDAPMISQEKLAALQSARPEEFKKWGIADIAQETGADAVISVYITQFATPTTTDGSVDEGYAEAYIKVIDKKGAKLYPGEATGLHIFASDPEVLVSDRNSSKTVQDLIGQLSTQTGRLFHSYSRDDKELNPTEINPDRQNGHPGVSGE